MAMPAEGGGARFLPDGSILVAQQSTPESIVLHRIRGPGRIERVGSVPRPTGFLSVSDDLKRAAFLELNYHGDAYMSRVVRP
jgi:hypothetical protein